MARLRNTRDQRGAAAVEFALVLPILILLVFGAIQYGFYFWAVQGGADAARYAARLSAVGDPASCSDFQRAVQENVGRYAQGDVTVTRAYSTPAHSDVQIGDTVTIHVTFESVDLHVPLVPFIDNGQITQSVTTRVDYVPSQPESCS